jgi:hypothetical protein
VGRQCPQEDPDLQLLLVVLLLLLLLLLLPAALQPYTLLHDEPAPVQEKPPAAQPLPAQRF